MAYPFSRRRAALELFVFACFRLGAILRHRKRVAASPFDNFQDFYVPSSPSNMFGGGISMIFFKTTGKEVWAPVAVSRVIIIGSPDMLLSKKWPTKEASDDAGVPSILAVRLYYSALH